MTQFLQEIGEEKKLFKYKKCKNVEENVPEDTGSSELVSYFFVFFLLIFYIDKKMVRKIINAVML